MVEGLLKALSEVAGRLPDIGDLGFAALLFLGLACFFGGVMAAVSIGALFGRMPIRVVGLRAVARSIRQLPKSLRRLGKGRARLGRAEMVSAASSLAAMDLTEVERALVKPDPTYHQLNEAERPAAVRGKARSALLSSDRGEDVGDAEPFDLTEAYEKLIFNGAYFKSIQASSGFFPERLTKKLDDAGVEEYLAEARRFFSRSVPLESNSSALYEDVEGEFIISLFRKNDRRCFLLLHEMRKVINDNARRLIYVYSLIFLLNLVFNLLLALIAPGLGALWGLLATLVSAILFLIFFNGGYQKQQEHNIRELRSFLIGYLGRVAERFRDATAEARGVTVGDETDAKVLAENARKWHKIIVWMPFRTFFIECFVRSIIYQVRRNCSYYLYIPPVFLGLMAIMAVLTLGLGFGQWTKDLPSPLVTLVQLAAIAGLSILYWQRIFKPVIGEEFQRLDWLGYDRLNVSSVMDDVVGKYAEDVGFWKGRLER
jgi:hypothetical protein